MDVEVEWFKYLRICTLLTWAWINVLDNEQGINTFPLLLYVITCLHDDDDKWLLDWIKWKIKQLTESLKLSKIKPITV